MSLIPRGLLPISPVAGADAVPLEAQRRLIAVRFALVLGEAVGILLLATLLDARLPLAALLAILALHLLLNAGAWFSLRQVRIEALEIALQLAVDAACIGALVYLTGGYSNPFISLLLVPLILGAVSLRPCYAWALAAWVGLIYTLLMRYYRQLELGISPEAAVHLHLQGMWLNFLLTAVLVAAFTGALAAALRARDAALAQAREQHLRDEQLFALGMQAAAAAHDLATPLASVRLTLDDLRQDFAGDEDLAPPLDLMAGQLQRVEAVLARLGEAARSRGTAVGGTMPARDWLARTLERWGLLHPHASVALDAAADLPAIEDDPVLETVLMTLLNNAVEASPGAVSVSARLAGARLRVEVADRGAGLGGKAPGWGVGLELAQGALARLGGRLQLLDREGGGVLARVELPLVESAP